MTDMGGHRGDSRWCQREGPAKQRILTEIRSREPKNENRGSATGDDPRRERRRGGGNIVKVSTHSRLDGL
jgi:hypothetical protein